VLDNGQAGTSSERNLQREFESIRDQEGVSLPHVPETRYLHSKLEHSPSPVPTFCCDGFRILGSGNRREDPLVDEEHPLIKLASQDDEIRSSVENIRRLQRVISELEVAKEIIGESLYKRFERPSE